MAQQGVRFGAVLGVEADADARREEKLAPGEHERPGERTRELLDHRGDVARIREVLEQHREFVAAQPGDRVIPAQGLAQPLADQAQRLVAGVVAEGVVDDLEAIEIEEQHRHVSRGPRGARARAPGAGVR